MACCPCSVAIDTAAQDSSLPLKWWWWEGGGWGGLVQNPWVHGVGSAPFLLGWALVSSVREAGSTVVWM